MKKYTAIIMIIIAFAVIGGILGLHFSYKEEGKENTSALNGEKIYYLKTISGNCTDSKDIIEPVGICSGMFCEQLRKIYFESIGKIKYLTKTVKRKSRF